VAWLLSKAREEANSGARPLRRAIQRYIEDELSEYMIRHKDAVPERIDFTMNGEDVLLIPKGVEEPIPN
jgi:ATP-dependent Clp protease ATP-binding subunit ClpA